MGLSRFDTSVTNVFKLQFLNKKKPGFANVPYKE